jgi:hypothetical protein
MHPVQAPGSASFQNSLIAEACVAELAYRHHAILAAGH